MSKRWLGLLLLTVWFGASGVAHATVMEMPDPIDVGPIAVGSSGTSNGMLSDSATRAVTLDLATGGDCSQFQIVSATSLTIGPTPVTVTVQLTPTSAGIKNCTITVTGGTGAKTFGVTGIGAVPQINVAPTSLAFSSVDVGATSATKRVTATNTGTGTLTITSATLTAGGSSYTVSGITGSQTVVSANSVHWDIACQPQAAGTANGTFQIVSNSATGSTANVDLTCSGDLGGITTNTSSLPFGTVLLNDNQTQTVTLTNTGNVAVTGITGTFDKPTIGYSITTPPAMFATLAANGGTATVTVKFAPVNRTDGGPATLTFRGSWGASSTASTDVALTGQTVTVTATPSLIDFMSFQFDSGPTRQFQIANHDTAAVSIDSVNFVPDDAGTAITDVFVNQLLLGATSIPNLPASLPGTGHFDVTVKAVPLRTGLVKGHFVVHSSAANVPDQSVVITGTATATTFAATPMLEFGPVDIDAAATAPPMQTATIMNSGTQVLDIISVDKVAGGSTAFTFAMPLPAMPVHLAPGTNLPIMIAYKPTTERTSASPETLTLSAQLGGVIGEPKAMITIEGHGIDRHLTVATPTFPPTFRNPGDAAPVQAVTVQNTGEAVLQITAVMVKGQPVWQLVDAGPVDIPGKTSHDFMVKFSPSDFGAAPPGQLTVMSNDNQNLTKTVALNGTGVPRDVSLGPDPDPTEMIDLGFTGVGIPITADDVLAVTNRDPNAAFTIHAIQLSGDPAFRVANAPTDIALPASAAKRFAITFDPTAVGDFHTTATLLLDQDQVSTADVQITGHAVFVDAHGSGGCDAGGTGRGGGLVIGLAALGVLGRRRRRSAR
jgi:hypothetical protein